MVNYTLQREEGFPDYGSLDYPQNTSHLFVEDYQPFWEFWVPGVLLPVVGVLGLVGNTFSIYILSRPQMRSSINCLLIGLATFDMILIATSILMFAIPSIYTHSLLNGEESFLSYYYEQIFPFITPIVFPVGLISQTGSVYLTVCVTMERYLAVCHPLKAKYLCTYGRAKLYVAVTALFSIGYNLPRFLEVTWSQASSPVLERNITEVVPTSLRLNTVYIEVYINWLYLIFLYLTPITILIIFNIRIYRSDRRAAAAQNIMKLSFRSQARELGLASMLLCVVMVFLLCNFPAMIVNILEHFGHQYHPLTQTNNLLVTINSSVNFIIYCIFGNKFKRIFLSLLCGFIRGRPAQTGLLRFHSQHRMSHHSNSIPMKSVPPDGRCPSDARAASVQPTLVVNPQIDLASSSSENEESLCQEDIQKLLGLQGSLVSLDKWDIAWKTASVANKGTQPPSLVSTTGV